ncbi:hypothetical protein Aperf_G00000116940 [Anoplocephala perfoliata]
MALLLNSGYTIPQLAFGTDGIANEIAAKTVETAYDAGYRHFDCAMIYGNEKALGEGFTELIQKYGVKREDIFVTSKLWCDRHDPQEVRKACEESIRNLGLEYLDLYLIHWPVSFHFKEGAKPDFTDPNCFVYEDHKIEDTWRAMEELVSAGLVKSVGVSNFNRRQIEHIIQHCRIVPAVNQIEVNLHWLNTKLIEFCQSRNIIVEGYSPFGSPGFTKGRVEEILKLKAVVEIAKNHNITPAQVVIRHALERKIVIISKTVSAERMHSNLDVFGFELNEDEMNLLNMAGRNKRIVTELGLANHPEYPFHEEF